MPRDGSGGKEKLASPGGQPSSRSGPGDRRWPGNRRRTRVSTVLADRGEGEGGGAIRERMKGQTEVWLVEHLFAPLTTHKSVCFSSPARGEPQGTMRACRLNSHLGHGLLEGIDGGLLAIHNLLDDLLSCGEHPERGKQVSTSGESNFT